MLKYRLIIRYDNKDIVHASLIPSELHDVIDKVIHKPLPVTLVISSPTGKQESNKYSRWHY